MSGDTVSVVEDSVKVEAPIAAPTGDEKADEADEAAKAEGSPEAAPSRLEARAPWVFGLAFALPTLLARYAPMTDLPLHEAVVGALVHMNDPKYYPPDLYHYNFGHPNQLFYLLAWPFAYIVGTTWAMKLVVAGTQVWLFTAAARFARYVKTPQWTALLVGALGLGWMFYWGLLANMLGLAALLYVIPTLDRFVERPTVKGALWSFAAMVLLYLAHETMMLCGCLLVGLFALGYGVFTRAFLLRLAPALAAFAMGTGHLWYAQRYRNQVNNLIPTLFHGTYHKFEIIPGVLFAGYEPYVRTLLFCVALMALLLFAVERWKERPALRGTPFRTLYVRYRFEILAGCLFLAYLVCPFTLSGSTLFYHRFFPPAYAIVAVVVAPHAAAGVPRKLARFVACTVPIASLLVAWPSFMDSDKVGRDLDAMIDHMEYKSAIIIVDMGPKPKGRLFAQSPMEGHVMAVRGGRTLFDFTRSPIAPAFMNPKYAWDEPYYRMQTQPIMIRPDHDLKRFRYVLFHTTHEDWGFVAEEAFGSDARLVAHQGEWFLFESTHLEKDLLAAGEPFPWPKPKSLRKRMKDIFRRLDGIPIPPDPVYDGPPPPQFPPVPEVPQEGPQDPQSIDPRSSHDPATEK